MRDPLDEFVLAVADAEAAVEADVHQPGVAAPAVGVDYCGHVNFASDDALQGLFRAVWTILVYTWPPCLNRSSVCRAAHACPSARRTQLDYIGECLNCSLRHRCGGLVRKSCAFSESLTMHHTRINIVIDQHNASITLP